MQSQSKAMHDVGTPATQEISASARQRLHGHPQAQRQATADTRILNTQCHAGLLFDWLYPAHFPTLRACLEAWADSPDVTTAMLKFMAEFALNKTQRLTFDSSSSNGILLFREVSKVSILKL